MPRTLPPWGASSGASVVRRWWSTFKIHIIDQQSMMAFASQEKCGPTRRLFLALPSFKLLLDVFDRWKNFLHELV